MAAADALQNIPGAGYEMAIAADLDGTANQVKSPGLLTNIALSRSDGLVFVGASGGETCWIGGWPAHGKQLQAFRS
jgi:hypothetical protein